MRVMIIALLAAISYAQTECKNFGREVNGVCECTPNYIGETCETRRTYEGWQWYVLYTAGETCADRGYIPIRESIECMIASRELYNWDIQKMAVTRFDEEGFPGCWTAPGVGSLNLDTTFLEAAVDINKWDMTRKLVCKHLINEEAPPQIKSRLVYGTTGQPSQDNKGLLQVWDLDWNYWCDVGKTSKQDLDAVANLACMEMGYAGFASIRGNQWTPNKMQDFFDEIFISEFDCLGAETSLFQCAYVKNDCIPNQAIEVTCSSEALTLDPTVDPTIVPTAAPTIVPTAAPTIDPTAAPTFDPTVAPTIYPTSNPTADPTADPCSYTQVDNGCPSSTILRNPGRLSTMEACADLCDADPDCAAYQVNTRSRAPRYNCLLYSSECNENRQQAACTAIQDCFYFEHHCPSCTLPSTQVGFDTSSASLTRCTSEDCSQPVLENARCAQGYSGEPSILRDWVHPVTKEQINGACNADSTMVILTGCRPGKCWYERRNMGCPSVSNIGNPGRLATFEDCQAICDARDDCDAIQINTRSRHPRNNCLLYSNECNEKRADGICTSIKDCFYFERVCEDPQNPIADTTYNPTLEPTINPTASPTADPTAGFVQGPKTGCKTGTKQPTTAQECREVAIANGVRYWGGNGHSSGADPKGCIYRTPDKDIYFNTHSTGSTSRGDRRTVCVPIPQNPIADTTYNPTLEPTINPIMAPTSDPSVNPTMNPTVNPTINPTASPTADPTTATTTPKQTEYTAPIVDTGNCAWESNWWWRGNNYCSCRGGYVKIGRWGYWSEWQKVQGNGVRCEADQLGDPLWGVTKECRCGQRGGKSKAGRRMLKILSEA